MSPAESAADCALREADGLARREAARLFDRPLIIEAGAGTGKTTILVSRILAWCLGPGWREAAAALPEPVAGDEQIAGRVVDRVAAITFTEAAAAEMAERVARALAAVERGEEVAGIPVPEDLDPEELQRRSRSLLEQVHRLRASTIHAFCNWILKRFPVEAGVDPGFVVDADALLAEQVAHEVVEDDLRTAFAGERWPRWLQLSAEGVRPDQVVAALVELVKAGVRAEDLERDLYSEEALLRACDRFEASLAHLLRTVRGRLEELPRSTNSQRLLRALAGLAAELDEGDPSEEVELRLEKLRCGASAAFEAGPKVLGSWAKGEFGKGEQEVLGGDCAAVGAAAGGLAEAWGAVVGLAVAEGRASCELVGGLLAETRRRLGARGILGFDDLLQGTRRLLQRHPEVRRELRGGLSQLLVDEFQDTDRSQCEIVRLLVFGAGGDPGRTPGLFVVGDPKQSIYGWRSADLAAYLDFVRGLEERGAVRHTLSVNFRSVPPILEEVERVVGEVMEETEDLQPPFQRLLPRPDLMDAAGFTQAGRAPVEYWISWPVGEDGRSFEREPGADASAELEAAAVAEDIRRLAADEGVAFAEIGILLRTTSKLNVVLGALRRCGVPFQVARDREYFRQREVVEAAALLRVILDPADQLALLTVLRSEVVGVPDAALVPLWRHGLPACLLELDGPDEEKLDELAALVAAAQAELPEDAPGLDQLPDWPAALLTAVEHLALLRHSFEHEPSTLFIGRLRSLWQAEISAATRYLGAHRVARLQHFFAEVERALAAPEGGAQAVARLLRRSVAGAQEGLQSATPERSRDAVQVMTVHGAKGLDFEHVYLLQMHAGTRPVGRREHEVVRGGETLGLRLFGWATPGLDRAEAFARKREEAELVRLLYVAMTRAKLRLVLAADWRGKHRGGARTERMLQLVTHRWAPELVERMVTERQLRMARGDAPAVQWVLPQLAASEVELTAPVVSPAATGVGEDPEELVTRGAAVRETAARHMRRPHSGGVSALVHEEGEPTGSEPEADGGAATRSVATAVGTAIHGLLEGLVLDGTAARQLQRRAGPAARCLAAELAEVERAEAEALLHELVDLLEGSALLARLESIGEGGILARELPLLLPPDPAHGPVGSLVGFADLVYRDPAAGTVVVADYKTDRVLDQATLTERAARYRPQLELYARALTEGLELEEPIRRELWFLRADRVVEV